MRRLRTGYLLAVILSNALFLAPPLFGQKADKEGKAWLNLCPDAATMNVTGWWRDPKWGVISLNQAESSRTIIGEGDGWDVSGVVSGNSVCLLFSQKGTVNYSAKLTAEASGPLSGVYTRGLLGPKSKTVPMRLVK